MPAALVPRREILTVVAPALVLLLTCSTVHGAAPPGREDQSTRGQDVKVAYREILGRYRAGDIEGAVARLRDWDRPRLERVRRLEWDDSQQPEDLAAVLHTEVAIRQNEGLSRQASHEHLDMAQWLIDRLASRRPPSALVRPWYLVVAAYLANTSDPAILLAHVSRARGALANEPGSNAAFGDAFGQMAKSGSAAFALSPTFASSEQGAPPAVEPRPDQAEAAVERLRWLNMAASEYEAALRGLPDDQQLRLKLGRVLVFAGRYDAAVSELAVVEQGAASANTRFLAALYLGAALDASRRAPEAVEAYRRACAIAPSARSSALALSEILQRTGHVDESRRVVGEFFERRTDPRVEDDPWWILENGHLFRFGAAMEQLHQAVAR